VLFLGFGPTYRSEKIARRDNGFGGVTGQLPLYELADGG
jgi:hypothetical protein